MNKYVETGHVWDINQCLCCKGTQLKTYLHLGMQPPPNAFTEKPCDHHQMPLTPLMIAICMECSHSQLVKAVDPEVLFANYAYRTGVSETLRQHYASLADDAVAEWKKTTTFNEQDEESLDPNVLDIGCNDGTLLSAFKEKFNFFTTGVDMCEVNHTGVDEYIEGEWGVRFLECNEYVQGLRFDIITATNVLAHTPNPKEFIIAIHHALEGDGLAVIEFPYAKRLIQEAQFDTMYFEHYSYFLVKSFVELLVSTGMYVSGVKLNHMHGGSIRFYLRKCMIGQERELSTQDHKVHELLCEERSNDLHANEIDPPRIYRSMQRRVQRIKLDLLDNIHDYDDTRRRVVGFGASAKSTVMTNCFDIQMAYIVDETPGKQGRFSPGKNIPIVDPMFMRDDEHPLAIVVMSWNCMAESLAKIREIRKGKNDKDIIITYLPQSTVAVL